MYFLIQRTEGGVSAWREDEEDWEEENEEEEENAMEVMEDGGWKDVTHGQKFKDTRIARRILMVLSLWH